MNKRLFAYADLPRTGLCNMLNPWARAFLWAKSRKCPMLAPNWVKILRVGPWLRNEKDKRYYWGQFSHEGYISGMRKWLILLRSVKIKEECIVEGVNSGVVVFAGQRNDLLDFPDKSQILREELNRIAAPVIKTRLSMLPSEFIGVHIRRGDFKVIGQTLTADYYCSAIEHAIKMHGNIPILVSSDAPESELPYLRQFANLRILKDNPALQDVLTLSRARCLVCTNGSSFSEWSAFLGGMPSIWSKEGRAVNTEKFSSKVILV